MTALTFFSLRKKDFILQLAFFILHFEDLFLNLHEVLVYLLPVDVVNSHRGNIKEGFFVGQVAVYLSLRDQRVFEGIGATASAITQSYWGRVAVSVLMLVGSYLGQVGSEIA